MKLFFFFASTIFLFTLNVLGQVEHLYKIETELIEGKKDALFKIGKYFDSSKKIIEYLGYHRIETTEADVAKRIVYENTAFTDSEIIISPKTTKAEFIKFLHANQNKITFSPIANAFLIIPLENRKIDFEVIEISPNKKAELEKQYNELSSLAWILENNIDSLIKSRNSDSLLKIASHLYKMRNRYNRYYFDGINDIALLQILMGSQIVVKNEKNEFSYHIESDYHPQSRLNLLIFFSKFHNKYRWNSRKSVFEHPDFLIKSQPNERLLFEKLSNEDNSIALDSFIELTETNPKTIFNFTEEYERADVDVNRVLPTFPFRFLRQLALLTDYCRKNNINYKGSEKIAKIIEKLKAEIPYSQRYKLENEIIENLTIDDITAFEYWALIYQSEWHLTYSSGRILDKVYARNWQKILADETQLNLYLKKSKLFDNIGIIGAVNKYLDKFIDSPIKDLERLKSIKSNDKDIIDQISKITKLNNPYQNSTEKETINKPFENLETKLEEFSSSSPISDKQKDELVKILSEISYEQIGIAIKYLERISFQNPSKYKSKFEFLEYDWGFNLAGDFDDEKILKEFSENYSKMSQSDLYAFYLTQNGFDFQKSDKSLDFDKLYEMLKYDEVEALAGGGGGRRDYHIYSLIKLLENKFNTTLNFSNKLCKSRHIFRCSTGSRAREWMKYLNTNHHLKFDHNEPTSFTLR